MAERKQEPVRRSVRVECPVEDAFRLFTEHFPEWWPAGSAEIEPWVGGRVLERTESGEERERGTVTAWEPPRRIAFDWQDGDWREQGQRVEVQFRTDAVGTEVIVTHSGWEASARTTNAVNMMSGAFSRYARNHALVMA